MTAQANQVQTPIFEGAFAQYLIDGDTNDQGNLVFSIRAVFDEFDGWNPEDPKSVPAWAKSAVKSAIERGKKTKWDGKVPSNLRMPFINGDDSDKPEFHGTMYANLKAYSKRPPIVGPNGKALMQVDQDTIYSGAKYRAVIQFAPYNNAGGKGVSGYIVAIQKVADGERKDGSISESQAESMFGDVSDDMAPEMAPEDDPLFD